MVTAALLAVIGTAIGTTALAVVPAAATTTTSATSGDRTAPAPTPASSSASSSVEQAARLQALGDLVAQRLELAGPVAASKWLDGRPIADPAREQAVVDAGVARARAAGIDPDLVERVLRDQIAASKLVQRGSFTRWTHEPWTAPTTAPDLAELRARITALDDGVVDAVGAVEDLADAHGCRHAVVAERHRVEPGLGSLERRALHVAWTAFCRP